MGRNSNTRVKANCVTSKYSNGIQVWLWSVFEQNVQLLLLNCIACDTIQFDVTSFHSIWWCVTGRSASPCTNVFPAAASCRLLSLTSAEGPFIFLESWFQADVDFYSCGLAWHEHGCGESRHYIWRVLESLPWHAVAFPCVSIWSDETGVHIQIHSTSEFSLVQ